MPRRLVAALNPSQRLSASMVERLSITTTNFLLLLTGLVGGAIVSRSLAPEGRGLYVGWQTWAGTIAVLALMGLPQALVLHGDSHHFGRRGITAALAIFILPASIVAAVVGLWSGQPLWVGAGMALFVISTGIGAVNAALEQRRGRLRWQYNLTRLMTPLVGMVVIIGLAVSGITSPVTWLVVVAVGQLIAVAVWFIVAGDNSSTPRESLKSVLRMSLVLGPGNLVGALQSRLDLLLVIALFDPQIVAFYAIGLASQAAIGAAGSSTTQRWFSSQRDRMNTGHVPVAREVLSIVLLAGAVAAPLVLTAAWWVPAIYGTDFEPAVALVAALSIPAIAGCVDFFAAHEALLRGRGSRTALLRLPSVVVLLLAGLITYHLHLPAASLAIAAAISSGLSATLLLRRARATSSPESTPNE